MEDYIINQWYFAPVWIVNAVTFGKIAYESFRNMQKNKAVIFSIGSACSLGLAGFSILDGLEKYLN